MNVVKKDNEFRIFTFGGSISRGGNKRNYPYILERLLNSTYPNKRFNVINFSADGYGSTRMLLLLKKVLVFEPDLIIWHIHGSNEYEDERDYEYKNEVNSGINNLIFKSDLFVILKKCYSFVTKLEEEVVQDMAMENAANLNPENQQRWFTTIDQNLSELSEISQLYKIPTLLVGRVEKNIGYNDEVTQRVRTFNNLLKKHIDKNIYYVDTPHIIQASFPDVTERDVVFLDSSHMIREGHEVLAIHIAKDIEKIFKWSSVVEISN